MEWVLTGFNTVLVICLGWGGKVIYDHLREEVRDVKRLRGVANDNAEKLGKILYQVYASEGRINKELVKLRGSVVRSALLIKRRRTETAEIRDLAKGLQGRLEIHRKFIAKGLEKASNNSKRLADIGSESVAIKIGNDHYIIKGKKKK